VARPEGTFVTTGDGHPDRTLVPLGGAVPVGGVLTSCFEAASGAEGEPELVFGPELAAVSEGVVRAFHLAAIAAPLDVPVILTGESGTGKELFARAIHDRGRGTGRPFVPLNMAAIPVDLAEAELFGWMRGSFTGASDSREGAFEQAAGGTLFLDEVGDAPLDVQAKLLRAVETGHVSRVGSVRPIAVRARIVAATNRHLPDAVSLDRFRLDLLQRLAGLVIHLPALRDRPRDLPVLVRRLCEGLPGRPVPAPSAIEVLREHDWPGNVRELRNVLRRAAILWQGGVLDGDRIRGAVAAGEFATGCRSPEGARPFGADYGSRVRQIARSGLARSTFYYRLKRGRIPAEAVSCDSG
jgi:two-component system nitrogen regulation response regulator GlnG